MVISKVIGAGAARWGDAMGSKRGCFGGKIAMGAVVVVVVAVEAGGVVVAVGVAKRSQENKLRWRTLEAAAIVIEDTLASANSSKDLQDF